MADLLSALSSLFTFLFAQMGNFTSFFVTNTLGQVILCSVLFTLIIYLLIHVIAKMRG